MGKTSLYRLPAKSNPTQHQHLPKEPMGLNFPLMEKLWTKSDWQRVPLTALLIVGVNCLWLEHAVGRNSNELGIALIAAAVPTFVIFAVYKLRVAVPVGIVMAAVQASVYLNVTGHLDFQNEILIAAFLMTFCVAIEKQRFFKELAISGYFTPQEKDAYINNGKVPRGIKPTDPFDSYWIAIRAWLKYDEDDSQAEGVHKPKLNINLRIARTLLVVVLWVAALLPQEISKVVASPEYLPISVFQFVLLSFGFPLTLGLCLTFRSMSRAGGILKQRQAVQRWSNFVESMRHAKNITVRNSIYLGRILHDGAPIVYPVSALTKGGWIQGSPGSGKTVLLSQIVEQLVGQGVSVVTLDLKATSHELYYAAEAAAKRVEQTQHRSVPLKAFTPKHGEATHLFDLFSQDAWAASSPEEKSGMMLGFMGLNHGNVYGESYFRDASWTVQQHLLGKYTKLSSFHEASTLLGEELKHAKEPWELSASSKRDGEHPRLILKRLGLTDAINVRSSYPQEVLDSAIKLETLFKTPSVLHCSLPAVTDPVGNPEIGRVILSTLLRVGANTPNRPVPVVVCIDEFQRMCSRSLDVILQQARSLGIGVVLTNQSSADLATIDPNLVDTIAACTQFQAWMRTTDNLGKQQIIDFGGEYMGHLVSKTLSESKDGPVTSYSKKEQVMNRVSTGLIDTVNSNLGQYFLRITENAGYCAFGAQLFVGKMDFHTTEAEFNRRSSAPWPSAKSGMLINGQHRPDGGTPPQSSLAPKTPSPPNSGWKPTKIGKSA